MSLLHLLNGVVIIHEKPRTHLLRSVHSSKIKRSMVNVFGACSLPVVSTIGPATFSGLCLIKSYKYSIGPVKKARFLSFNITLAS